MVVERQLFVWVELARVLVVNRPSAIASNESKPGQAELIRGRGFQIPATLVTTTPDAARAFIAEHRRVIYKSVSGQRSVVSRVTASELESLDDVATCATQFQAHVPGTDWRVHVVGDDVHACEIRCAADDYRMAHLQGEPIEFEAAEPPASVVASCHALTRHLGLSLAGIDLRRTSDDVWYCFEVNTAPAFTYFEQMTGQPLTAAVAQLLADARRSDDA